jgi:hypothetical protein
MATEARTTQLVLEVLRQEGQPQALVSQLVLEVLRANTAEAPAGTTQPLVIICT